MVELQSTIIMKAIALRETKLTKDLLDSSAVTDPSRVFLVNAGSEFDVKAIAPQIKNKKRLVTFPQGIGKSNYNSWFIWPAHWRIEGEAKSNYAEATGTPKGTPEASKHVRKVESSAVPKSPVNWQAPNALISQYFQVWECTKGDDRRIPTRGSEAERNILRIAAELDKIREEWGGSIVVTSWYRPPAVNQEIGGARYSQHLSGGAVDIYTADGRDWEFEDFLDRHWGGGLGFGISSGRGFTHLDLREGSWRRGAGSIRWMY
jgi:hypothetical protein